MTILAFTLILLLAAYSAGLLGSLTGLGGGVVVIPVLTLGFGVDFHYAIGAALVASIATSSGSGSAYVKEGITNVRLGMFLEIATTIGAVCGAAVAVWRPSHTSSRQKKRPSLRWRRKRRRLAGNDGSKRCPGNHHGGGPPCRI